MRTDVFLEELGGQFTSRFQLDGTPLPRVPAARVPDGRPPECLELYYAVEALRAEQRSVAVQFVAPSGGEGTSTVASGFIRVAGIAAGHRHPVLYVDCDSARCRLPALAPFSLTEVLVQGRPLDDAIASVRGAESVCWASLAPPGTGALPCGVSELGTIFEELRRIFPVIVLDSPAIGRAALAAPLSRHCDGTILVVRAERTRTAAIQAARLDIERAGGQVIGTVLNRRRSLLPSWLAGWL